MSTCPKRYSTARCDCLSFLREEIGGSRKAQTCSLVSKSQLDVGNLRNEAEHSIFFFFLLDTALLTFWLACRLIQLFFGHLFHIQSFCHSIFSLPFLSHPLFSYLSWCGMNGTSAESVPNLQFEFKWQDDTLNVINVIGNSISVASGMTVLIVILGLRIYDKQLVDRVSLRLSAAISVTDVISSAALLIYTYVTVEGGACVLSPFLIIFLTNLFLFLTTVSMQLFI